MNLLLSAALVVAVLVSGVDSQSTACPATSCYYDGATVIMPNSNNDPLRYFAIGGFFDVHEPGSDLYQCSSTFNDVGFLNLQAFLWAVTSFGSEISNRGVSTGAIAYDVCGQPAEVVTNFLSFSTCRTRIQGIERENVVAYVGPYGNEQTARAGHVASDLGITILSPTADSSHFQTGMERTMLKLTPAFSNDMMVVAQVLKRLVDADYVLLVHDPTDPFWRAAYMALRPLIQDSSIKATCISYDGTFDGTGVNQLITELNSRRDVKYVVPLMSGDKLLTLMKALNEQTEAGSFILVVTSDVGRDVNYFRQASVISNNTIIVESVTSASVQASYTQFANYMNDVRAGRVNASQYNTFLTEYMRTRTLPNVTDVSSKIRNSIERTLQSVQIIVQGMVRVLDDCGGTRSVFCDQYRNQVNSRNLLYTQIKGSGLFSDTSGDLAPANTRYNVYHAYVDNRAQAWMFDLVADYANGVMSQRRNLLDNNAYGLAFTDTRCVTGECCVTVAPTTTTVAPNTTTMGPTTRDPSLPPRYAMVRYPYGQDITGAYMDEHRGDGEYGTRFDDDHMWVIALGVLAGLGILCVAIFEIYILYKLLGTRLAHTWRTMWLGQLLLFGILLCYLTLIAFIFTPTRATCGITRFGVGVSYAFCFAVLLVKLMVILTSKSSDVLLPGEESPNYLRGIYQFLMFAFAVGVQVVIDVQWLITVPPEAVKVVSNNGEHVWICNHYTWEAKGESDEDIINSMTMMSGFVRNNFENHVMSLIYIMVLIFITTVLSLNAHGIITNHRESVFIGIASGFSIPIWLAWGLVGGLNDDHEYAQEFGDACIAFGLFLTASLILFAMFLPKVRQLVNMGVEGIYLEDDRDTYYGGSVIMAPPSYKSKGPNSVIYVNNQGIYSEPVVIGNGDPSKDGNVATHLRHPGSTYSAPPNFMKKADSTYGGSRVLRVTDDLRGRHPQKRPQSEVNYGSRPRSQKGTLPRSRSQTNLGAL